MQKTNLLDAQPVGKVSGVGEGSGQTDDTHFLGGVGGDEVGAGDNHLQHRASLVTWVDRSTRVKNKMRATAQENVSLVEPIHLVLYACQVRVAVSNSGLCCCCGPSNKIPNQRSSKVSSNL